MFRVPSTARSLYATATSIVTAAALLVAPLSFLAQPAQAFEPWGCKWNFSNVKYYISNNDLTTQLNGAAQDWNSIQNKLTWTEVNNASNRDFKFRAINLGPIGYSGLWHGEGNWEEQPVCNNNNRWVQQANVATVNTYYHSGSDNKRRGVAVHELGHAAGLAHENSANACPGGGAEYIAIMYYSDARFTGNCPVFAPTPDDKAGIQALY